jgi:hypothetical protein
MAPLLFCAWHPHEERRPCLDLAFCQQR